MWDLKTASTEKSANSAIRHGLKQIQENPGGIILNYEKNEISVDLLKEILQKRLNASATQNVDIVVLANDKLLTVQRFIAKKIEASSPHHIAEAHLYCFYTTER